MGQHLSVVFLFLTIWFICLFFMLIKVEHRIILIEKQVTEIHLLLKTTPVEGTVK